MDDSENLTLLLKVPREANAGWVMFRANLIRKDLERIFREPVRIEIDNR
jgi:hypothetical protein